MGRSSGMSPKPKVLRDVATWVLDYLDSAALGQVDIIGHSMGGAVGLAFALEYPQRVRSLALFDIGYFKIRRFPTDMFGPWGYLVPVISFLQRALGNWLLGKSVPLPSPTDPEHENVDFGSDGAALMLTIYRADLPAMLRLVRVPCVLFYATADKEPGRTALAKALEGLAAPKNVQLIPMSGGHYGHLTDPDAMTKLQDFLDAPADP